jgi:hypothetical protein
MHPIATAEALARTGAFALRQRGLGKVTNELTDFRGCDLHITARPELIGMHFDEIVGRFTNARPLGIARHDGRFELNPPADATLDADDRLIVIADDIERIETSDEPIRLRKGGPVDVRTAEVDEHVLVIGWNRLGAHLLSGWAAAASATSSVAVAFDPRLIEPGDIDIPALGVDVELSPAVEVSSITFGRTPTTIVALGYTSIDSGAADARTMLDVMSLRRRLETSGRSPRLVVQLLDDDHVDLAALPGPDDLLISAALGSQFIAQLIEQPERREVLLALYGGDGASIRLVRCDRFDLVGALTMEQVVARAYDAGVLAIGWRCAADGTVVLNARAETSVTLGAHDELVVVG